MTSKMEVQMAKNEQEQTKRIYLKRGYKEIEYNIIKTDNGDCLCYDGMRLEKKHG